MVINAFTEFQAKHGTISVVIHGDAQGLDRTAAWVAQNVFGIVVQPFPADWSDVTAPGAVIRYRRGVPYNALAGHWRNQAMIDNGKPDWGMVFPGGTGTDDMRLRLQIAGIQRWSVTE